MKNQIRTVQHLIIAIALPATPAKYNQSISMKPNRPVLEYIDGVSEKRFKHCLRFIQVIPDDAFFRIQTTTTSAFLKII